MIYPIQQAYSTESIKNLMDVKNNLYFTTTYDAGESTTEFSMKVCRTHARWHDWLQ